MKFCFLRRRWDFLLHFEKQIEHLASWTLQHPWLNFRIISVHIRKSVVWEFLPAEKRLSKCAFKTTCVFCLWCFSLYVCKFKFQFDCVQKYCKSSLCFGIKCQRFSYPFLLRYDPLKYGNFYFHLPQAKSIFTHCQTLILDLLLQLIHPWLSVS